MQINKKKFLILSIIFSILTIISIFLRSRGIAILFLGFSQLFIGIDRVRLPEDAESKEIHKGNKAAGTFSIVVGLFIIIIYIIDLRF